MVADPHWTAYVSALGTPIIAAVVAVIAYRQWRTAHNRLKFDLFEKRFQAYKRLYDLMQAICQNAKLSNDEYVHLIVETRDIKWLFGRRFRKYVYEKILPAAKKMRNTRIQIENLSPNQDDLIKAELDLTSWFADQMDVIEKKVSHDLKLRA